MEQNVRITVISRIQWEDGTTEQNITTAAGQLTRADGGWRVRYAERAEDGLGGAVTQLTVSNRGVLWTREGTVRCRLTFAEGSSCSTVYETAQGSFPMEARTLALRAELDGDGGVLELCYALRVGGAAGVYRLSIQVGVEEEAT